MLSVQSESTRAAAPFTRRMRGARLLLAFAALFLVGGAALALSDAPSSEGKCPVAEKLSALLASWKVVHSETKGTSEAEQAKLGTELATLAKECPVGSRLGETFGFVKAVLQSTLGLEDACSKNCPITVSGDKAACQVKEARASLLTGLNELASNAAGACGGCPAKDALVTSKDLAEKALLLKASWDKAPAEVAAMPAEKKKQTLAAFGALAQRSKAVSLLPPTVEALGAGFEALDSLNGKLGEWVKAHPDAFKDVPEDAKKAMEGQMALLHATGEILQRATSTIKCCNPECCAVKTETASTK